MASGNCEIPHSAHQARALSVGPGLASPVAVRLPGELSPSSSSTGCAGQPGENLGGIPLRDRVRELAGGGCRRVPIRRLRGCISRRLAPSSWRGRPYGCSSNSTAPRAPPGTAGPASDARRSVRPVLPSVTAGPVPISPGANGDSRGLISGSSVAEVFGTPWDFTAKVTSRRARISRCCASWRWSSTSSASEMSFGIGCRDARLGVRRPGPSKPHIPDTPGLEDRREPVQRHNRRPPGCAR